MNELLPPSVGEQAGFVRPFPRGGGGSGGRGPCTQSNPCSNPRRPKKILMGVWVRCHSHPASHHALSRILGFWACLISFLGYDREEKAHPSISLRQGYY